MFNFFKKRYRQVTQPISDTIDNRLNQVMEKLRAFYQENESVFNSYFSIEHDQRDKKEFIRQIYGLLHYDQSTRQHTVSNMTLYRGLRAETAQDIINYTEGFSNGPLVFGQKASLHGTGIYMSTELDTANKYAKYNSDFGSTIACQMSGQCKMIDESKLTEMKESVLGFMRLSPPDENFVNYINLLEDNGVFAAITGYDAVNIPDKNYVLILNRGVLAVENVSYYISQEISDLHVFDDRSYDNNTIEISGR